MRVPLVRSLLLALMGVTGLLVLAGCGGDEEPPTDSEVTLKVLVHIVDFPSIPGLSEDTLLGALQSELDSVFMPEIQPVVELSDSNFLEILDHLILALYEEFQVFESQELLGEIVQAEVGELEYSNDQDQARIQYQEALDKVEEVILNGRNWAEFEPGVVGLSFQGTKRYGGQTLAGERWSTVATGVLEFLFPEPAALNGGDPDFSGPEYDEYRSSYDDQKRLDYAINYLTDTSIHQLGLQFGLQANNRGLHDYLNQVVLVTKGEHFLRSSLDVRLSPADRDSLVDAAGQWIREER